jgi:hypothetical protein
MALPSEKMAVQTLLRTRLLNRSGCSVRICVQLLHNASHTGGTAPHGFPFPHTPISIPTHTHLNSHTHPSPFPGPNPQCTHHVELEGDCGVDTDSKVVCHGGRGRGLAGNGELHRPPAMSHATVTETGPPPLVLLVRPRQEWEQCLRPRSHRPSPARAQGRCLQ